jgi:hypothetical protein
MKTKIILLFFILISLTSWSQTKYTISGNLKDASTGEDLIGASVYIKELQTGSASNVYGFYSLTIPSGKYTAVISYIGYESITQELTLTADTRIDFSLTASSVELEEIVITDKSATSNIDDNRMSSEKLAIGTIKKAPAFMGEVDVLKTIQALPGVQSGGEGTTGFFVRGGAVDQNLIQLDEATVYNASHLMGFFSVFNADAIKDVELYKGGIPAQYGGRVASLLDIRLKEGNQKKLSGSGGIGTITSRFTLEGPIQKDQSSFIISGRRTYGDLFLKASPDQELRNNKLFFYDLNSKVNFRLGERDRIFISGYFGDDVFRYKNAFHWKWGNRTGTARWNHLFNEKLFANITLLYSNFNYNLGSDNGPSSFDWKSSIIDRTVKADFSYFPSANHSFNFGFSSTYHTFQPGKVSAEGTGLKTTFELDKKEALESAIYFSADIKFNDALSVQAGLRTSLFTNVGGQSYKFADGNPIPVDTILYANDEFFHTYVGFEPRLNIKYSLSSNSSIKASYNRMYQYLHLASNTTSSIPLDVYIPSNETIKPQIADQFAVGYFKNMYDNKYEFSTEVYYKYMQNQIDFKDNADLLLNNYLEREILSGKGEAYGIEFMIKKTEGRFNGWASYTLSRSLRTIEGINEGKAYAARQDRPHAVNIVTSYQFTKRLQVGASWNFASGMPVTLPASSYEHDGVVVPVYNARNDYRLPSSHRLDLSVTLDNKKKEGRRWESSWNFSLYNVYARKNPFSLQTRQNEDNPAKTEAVQLSLIGTIIPSVTYNFKF